MGDYFYLDDPDSGFGYIPVSADEYVAGIFRVAKKYGLKITDREILETLNLKEVRKNTQKISRTNLYIDGTNLFAGQNELFGPEKFLPFPVLLKEINKLFKITRVYFYCSYMVPRNKTRQELKLISNEAQFYRQVRDNPKVIFYKGHRSPTSGKEKGVDVHLAADIIKDAFLKKYDQMVIMTGDADLIYPVEIVKSLGLKTHAVFFPNRFSLELAFKADRAIVLNYNNKFSFFGRKLPKNLKIISIKKPRM